MRQKVEKEGNEVEESPLLESASAAPSENTTERPSALR